MLFYVPVQLTILWWFLFTVCIFCMFMHLFYSLTVFCMLALVADLLCPFFALCFFSFMPLCKFVFVPEAAISFSLFEYIYIIFFFHLFLTLSTFYAIVCPFLYCKALYASCKLTCLVFCLTLFLLRFIICFGSFCVPIILAAVASSRWMLLVVVEKITLSM